jgi:hypothetical protein
MNEEKKPDFEKISPTAFMTCLARQFSGIPYSREIAERAIIQHSPYLPLLLESRYRAINRQAERQNITQVLELASGFLPRGMQMTLDPQITFIESDLPETIAAKRKLCESIIEGRTNLHFVFSLSAI